MIDHDPDLFPKQGHSLYRQQKSFFASIECVEGLDFDAKLRGLKPQQRGLVLASSPEGARMQHWYRQSGLIYLR